MGEKWKYAKAIFVGDVINGARDYTVSKVRTGKYNTVYVWTVCGELFTYNRDSRVLVNN